MSASLPSSRGFLLAVVCGLLTLGPWALRVLLLQTRTFDADEFQHLHAAWALHSGLIPFRDFFEHHMPGIQLLLAPLMDRFDIADSADSAMRFMVLARALMTVFAAVAIACTIAIAARRGGSLHALVSGALVSTSVVFLGRSLEIRPDTPSVALWLASLLAIQLALLTRSADRGGRAWWAIGGLCLGCALTFNQKLLLAGPGLALWAAAFVFQRQAGDVPRSIRRRIVHLALFCTSMTMPLVALALWFARHGALAAMLQGAVAGNFGWPREVAAATTLQWMALRDPLFSAFAVAGFVRIGLQLARTRTWGSATGMLWLAGASLSVFFFITPTPFPQYLLVVLPIGAIFGADALWSVVTAMSGDGRRGQVAGVDTAVVLTAFVAAAVPALVVARPFFVHWTIYPALALAALLAVVNLVARQKAIVAVMVVLVASSVYPLQQMRWMAGLSNAEQVRAMRYVHDATTPGDTVLDGFSGRGWFRLSASYFGFLHPGVRAFLNQRQKADIVATIRTCATRPRAVLLDDNLRSLSPDVEPLVAAYFREGEVPGVWLRVDGGPACGSAVAGATRRKVSPGAN